MGVTVKTDSMAQGTHISFAFKHPYQSMLLNHRPRRMEADWGDVCGTLSCVPEIVRRREYRMPSDALSYASDVASISVCDAVSAVPCTW